MNTSVHQVGRREQRRAEMRQRIVDAAIELHQSIGPARTTIADIARRASVQRLTVYRYFPDERSLRAACSTTFRLRNPPPDPEVWRKIPDPGKRLRRAFGELLPYYRRTQAMSSRVLRDAEINELVREAARGRQEYAARVRAVLEPGWAARGRRTTWVRAAIGHATDFRTWESLAHGQGLDDDAITEVLVAMVGEVAAPCNR
jgi:AcrR family transcriptional regulator